ncbi:M13 family metallopeptidase [Cognatiluteimonas lumbrici]|uniref:M13 family metallopeptidase n=1 Tax=Cognatiluteimonas lumbrici TaxID=2559601 RepID=UPI00112C02E1|nr:M13-type metalloendopeptidase [Luteimonas lumbrici]
MTKTPSVLLLSLAVAAALAGCRNDQSATSADAPDKPATTAAELPPTAAFALADLDTTADACEDLNAFVNGKWLAAHPVPSDRTTWGSFEMLDERSEVASRNIAEAAAADANATGTAKLVGDFYASGMDVEAINAAGLAPIQPILDRIDAIDAPEDIAAFLRDEFAAGRGDVFAFFAEPDFRNSSQMIGYAYQSGLALPERAYYLEDGKDGQYAKIRDAYVAHVGKQLQNAGVAREDAEAQAAAVLAFETRLAKASLAPVELRNPNNQYNYVTLAEADKGAKNFPWSEFMRSQGLDVEGFSLSQPKFFAEFDRMIADVPVEDWKAYLRINAIDGAAPYLADTFADERFDFFSRTLRGQKEQKERWKRVMDAVEGMVGEALGQMYVKEYFPAESKAEMEKLVDNLSAALKTRLEGLEWMGDETKQKALEKWESFTPKIGYPDKWRSWDGLATTRDGYAANVLAAAKFNHDWELSRIGKPVDRTEWGMTPQTVNAYYNPLKNEIVFPAAILQPPFFDPDADPALNYGGIGAVIGHEMLHGYDDQGSQFDATGNFANWWQEADRKGFEARTAKLVQQFDDYESIDGLHVKGQLTLGENIADLGGLTVAYDALQKALADAGMETGETIDGYTQDQRFFINWATVWRRNYTPDELKVRLNTDPHAPAKFRAIGAPSNMPTFATAFQCEAGDAMVRPDDKRVVIW